MGQSNSQISIRTPQTLDLNENADFYMQTGGDIYMQAGGDFYMQFTTEFLLASLFPDEFGSVITQPLPQQLLSQQLLQLASRRFPSQ